MRRPSALVSTLMDSLSTASAIAAWLVLSLAAATEIVNQDAESIISGSISSKPFSAPSNTFALQVPEANSSLSLTENVTDNIQFHIPNSPIDLVFTVFGSPILYSTVSETVELALNEISSKVALHPTESITDGFFAQSHDGLQIGIYQYVGQHVTWYLLDQLLLGMQYYAAQASMVFEIRVGIDVEGKGRVGHGVLWHTGLVRGSSDVAKRATAVAAVNETSSSPPQQLSMLSSLLTNSTATNSSAANVSPLIIPPTNNRDIILSYHFFGPPILETALSHIFALARRHILPYVQLHPHDPIPDGCFEFRADDSISSRPMSISVEAYAANEISWRLLDHVLADVEDDMIGGRHLWACEFEFEIEPFREAYGHGFVEFDRVAGETF